MAIENYENDSQEGVVDPIENNETEENSTDSNEDLEIDQAEKNEDVADSYENDEVEEIEEIEENDIKGQTIEENAQFKKMRIKAEEQAKKNIEKEMLQLEKQKEELDILRQEKEARDIEMQITNTMLTEDNINQIEISEEVSREVAIKLLQSEADKLIVDERNKINLRHKTLLEQKTKLKNDEFFNLIENEVDEIVKNNNNVDFETAYNYTVGRKHKELKEKIGKTATQQTLANVQDRMKRKNILSDSNNAKIKKQNILSEAGSGMAEHCGIDKKSVAKRIEQNRKTLKK